MTTLVGGWIIVMLLTTLWGVCNNHKDISIPFTIVMLAGMFVLGIGAMLSML